MSDLKSYISLVEPRLLCHIKGNIKTFIQTYQEGNYISEEVFIHKICGDGHSKNYYHNLKKRAIEVLQSMALISQFYGVSTVKKKYDLCQKKFIIGKKLLAKGHRTEGINQIKKSHKIATEYNFVCLASELSSLLYLDHVYYNQNPRKAIMYEKQAEQYLTDYFAEKKAEHRFYKVISNVSGTLKINHLEEALDYIQQFNGTSIVYKVYFSTLQVFAGFHKGAFNEVIDICRQTLSFFQGKAGVYRSHHLFFYRNCGKAHMLQKNFTAAEQNFSAAEAFAPTRHYNGYVLRLYKTLNALHSGNYHRAHDLYKENRKCRFENIKEQFAIIEAYLCFLSHVGKLELKHPFRLGKYLNETFKAQSDKEGSNIAILIAELLVYLGRDRGKFIDRIEAVQNYSYRHLKTKDTRRAKRFIKILCMLPKVNFHPVALARNAQRHIQYLKDHPIAMGENISIEILPFELVLEMIVQQLARKVA